MNISSEELDALGFQHTGTVYPDAAKALRVQIDRDVPGFVVYLMVVNDEVKKAGTTGRNNSTFKGRMNSTFSALRNVLTGPSGDGSPAGWRSRPLDPFKQNAPATILAGYKTELWALEFPSFEAMMAKETELNNKYRGEWTNEGKR